MERPQNLTINTRLATGIIILFHVVGLIGFALPATRLLFLQIVPFHLLLMLVVIGLNHKNINSKFGLLLLILFFAGYVVEWVGVHTGLLFGSYAYGGTLGYKVLGIPLMIGVNWFLLVYAAGITIQHSRLKSVFFRVITGSAALVLLDVLIEPVAIKFDYWHWINGTIPLKNYICWFLVSAVLLYVFELFCFKKQSYAAPVLLITEFVFFGLLNLVLLF